MFTVRNKPHVDERVDKINKLIVELASGNLDAREAPSDSFDELDAVIAGINMLGEELQSSTVSRNYLKSIYEGIVDMVIILSEEGSILSVNSSVTSLLGYSEAELLGMHFGEIFNVGSDAPFAFFEHLQSGKSLHDIQATLRTENGHQLPVSASCSVLFDAKQENCNFLLIAKDMTMQKQVEAELKKNKEAAELSNKLKSSFLANMSHEIRTPLNGILGFTEYLMSMGVPADQNQYLKLIQNSGKTLMKLLSDILDINKIEEGKLVLEPIPVHLKEFLSSSLLPYKYMANEKGVDFELSFNNIEKAPYILCDAGRINQVLVNLVGNSLKFTSTGKIKVSIDIVKDLHHENKVYVKGMVQDTGIGIPADKRASIFQPFVQSDSSITRRFGGSGLGLSIVSELLYLMNGGISVNGPTSLSEASSENPGSDFHFWLEAEVAPEPAKEVYTETEEMVFAQPYTVLIVEDNEMNRLLARKLLEKMGAQVEWAENGQQAVNLVSEKVYDAILMDVQMPVMDGLEATRIIRLSGVSTPIIGLSANVYKEDLERCKEMGMTDHVGKPFSKVSLFRCLQKHLLQTPIH